MNYRKNKTGSDYLISMVIMMIIAIFPLLPRAGNAQSVLPYRDSSLPIETRVKDLLDRMTMEEKFRQIFMIPGDLSIGKEKLKAGIFGLSLSSRGNSSFDSPGQMAARVNEIQKFFREDSRLGIPVIVFDEALHGLIREGATIFPQSIGLAATFDVNLMHKIAQAIARETRSRGIRQVLSPVLNIARDVRWGRTEETYGEDPFLVSQMGIAYISGMEKAGIIATPKHFAVNVGEGGRDSYPIHYNERIMEEIYFPAFRSAIHEAGAQSVMTAYNSFDGSPCTANNWLLNKKLKQEWGFRGFVISDACAVGGANVLHFTSADYGGSGKMAIENGLDVIFQTEFDHMSLFYEPFGSGKVRLGAIDSAVSRVLCAKFELGLFENPYVDPSEAKTLNGTSEHRSLALQAARESIVLLKNESHVLPLGNNIKSIAVIGIDAIESRSGGYSGPGNRKISIFEGIRSLAPEGVKVSYSPGCGRIHREFSTVPEENLFFYKNGVKQAGLWAEYFDNTTLDGAPKISRKDANIDFSCTLYEPAQGISNNWYSIRWKGKIANSDNGNIKIGIEGNDGYRLYIDGKLMIDNWVKKSFGTHLVDFYFEKAREYDIQLEYHENTGNAKIKLVWTSNTSDSSNHSIRKAVDLVRESDIAIFAAGIEEGEFRDRSSLKLPGLQEDLIHAMAITGKPVIVLLVGGSAVTMNPWVDQVRGIADVWYPGEAGGQAVAEVLFGRYNPAGRLPVTFPLSEGQLPLVYNHKPTGRGDDYNDLSGMPLFPFGYGLSYTTFEYRDLSLCPDLLSRADSTMVRFKVKNTGNIAGDEVCQLYIHDELATVARPVMELKGFRRIHLETGEEKEVAFFIGPEMFKILDKNMKPVIETGIFSVMIGSSSKDIRLRGNIRIQ